MNIKDFNKKLIEDETKINILDYVKLFNNNKIELDFVEKLLELVKEDTINIPHTMLYEFGVLNINESTNQILRLIKQYNLEENTDFLPYNVVRQTKRGERTIIIYYFHPDAFEICLMRSKNEKKYAHYYILLRKSIYGYTDYIKELNTKILLRKIKEENELKEKQIKEENDKIINKKNKKLKTKIDKIDELIQTVDDMKKQNNLMLLNSNKLLNKVDNLNMKLDKVIKDMILKDDDDDKNGAFIILKQPGKSYNYLVIRGQRKYILNKMTKLQIENPNIKEVLHFSYEPNPNTLWNVIKKHPKIHFKNNKFNITNITEEIFKNEIETISKNRVD